MRAGLIVLTLFTGAAAFGQSNAAATASPFKLELTSPAINQAPADFLKPHTDFHIPSVQLWKSFAISGPRTLRQRADAQIDPGMIIRPPKSSVGVQPPGTPIAQNLYPGLRLLPIDAPKGMLEKIPTEWPNLNLQNIPITWPKYEVSPANGDPVTP